MTPYWYKEAIIYELHVKCFYDSNGDGIGDFAGLIQKLDYLQDLGVTAIWLLPFYPSPLKDDGYDISNYMDVHSPYGNLRDFRILLREAHRRHLKVITELVINHTSDQHPWFQRARQSSAHSRERDFYVWSETPDKYQDARIIFQDFEASNWTWDRLAQSYYWHRFYSHQPDLNFDNPAVHRAVFQILTFWFNIGVDGVRLDAVPYLYEREGTNCENLEETHLFLKKLRTYVDENFNDRLLLAEANQWPEDAAKYFGQGDECHMAFHFPVMPRLFMAIHLEDAIPIIEIMGQTPAIPENCQWALFLRNHDELTLEMVTDEERDYMYRVYAYDPQARLNLGIRRRLAPLLKNDRRKIELMKSLLFSLHGTPVLYYGDEIGMGDNIYLGDRNGVRTPMQWSSDKNAGFSRANPQQLYLPPIVDPEYHYETVNVEAQLNNPHSLLWWTKQLITLRKHYKAFSNGSTEFLLAENRKILIFFRIFNEETILIVANLSRYPQFVELDLKKYIGYHPVEMFSGESFPEIGELPYFLTIGAYGYYWFALEKRQIPSVNLLQAKKQERDIPEIVLKGDKERLFSWTDRRLLENIVQKYLLSRLFKKQEIAKVTIFDHAVIKKVPSIHLVFVEILLLNGSYHQIPLFLMFCDKEKCASNKENIVAIIKNGIHESVLFDGGSASEVSRDLLDIVDGTHKIKSEKGSISGLKFGILTDKCRLKIFSLLENGIDSDIEMRTFLAKKTQFRAFLPLLGLLEYRSHTHFALGEVSEIPSAEYQAKSTFVEGADLFLQRMHVLQEPLKEEILLPKQTFIKLAFSQLHPKLRELLENMPEIARTIGVTAAEFHLAMQSSQADLGFVPILYTGLYQRSLYQEMRRKASEALARLKKLQQFSDIQQLKDRIFRCMSRFLQIPLRLERIRYHGNFTLENLYYTGKEVLISNFGGDPILTFAEKKYKRSPLRDVAALLFSFAEAGFEAFEKIQKRGSIAAPATDTFKQWAFAWATWMGSAFIRSYLRTLKQGIVLAENQQQTDFILGLFLLEKCLEKIADPSIINIEVAGYLIKYWLPIYEPVF